MDIFNKAMAQLSDLFRSMTPGARITAALLLVVVVISIGYLFRYEASSADTDLMNGEPISAGDMDAMLGAFNKAHLEGYVVEGSRIRVPRGQQAAYLGALASAKALPANFGSYFMKSLEDVGPFTTQPERDQRNRITLQQELALIIRSMPGIVGAMVILDSEAKPAFGCDPLKTASVNVKAAGAESVSDSQIEAIGCLVTSAVAGLKPESVTVIDINTGGVHHPHSENGGIGSEDTYLTVQRKFEEKYKRDILNALSFIPNISVQTSVTLNPEKFEHKVEFKPDKGVLIHRNEKSHSSAKDGSAGGPGGRPGYQSNANQPTSLAGSAASAKGSHEEEETSDVEERNLPGSQQTEIDKIGLTPEVVRVTVGIPNSYFAKIWRELNPVAAGQEAKAPDPAALEAIRTAESAKIQKHIAGLGLPAKGVTDPNELVTITTFQDIKPGEIPLPGIGDKVLVWLSQYWSTLGLIGLGLVSLVVLRSMVRATGGTAEPVAVQQMRVAAEPEAQPAESVESVAARRLRRLTGGGPSLRDELSELVKEDPDAAANILRSWIGQVT
jgi:flagellar M-ring protein FliF